MHCIWIGTLIIKVVKDISAFTRDYKRETSDSLVLMLTCDVQGAGVQ